MDIRVPALSLLTLLAGLTVVPTGAKAQQRDTPNISFDAFGTLGFAYSSEDEADFSWNILRPHGPGHTETVSPDVDSRLGGQVTAAMTPELTAVVQVVSEQRSDDTYTPRVEWASVEYAFTQDFSVRVGRTTAPSFLVSDYRKVSFVNPWVRPPVELYGLISLFVGDGVDARYRFRIGEWTNTVQGFFGRFGDDLPDGSEVTSDNAVNLNGTFQKGMFTGRLAFTRGELDIGAFDPLFDGFRDFGPEGEAIADRYEVDDTPFQIATAGAEYDPGRWFGMAEIGWADYNSVLGEKLAGYVTMGYRVGPVTPYATYSRAELLSETSADGLTVEGLPPQVAPIAAGLNAFLNQGLRSSPVQQNASFGGRWDFRSGMALKLQIDFIDVLDASPGTFINTQPEFEPGGSAQLVSLVVDFVL